MAAAATSLSPLNKIEKAHQMYRDGRHEEALGFYTEALFMAKTIAQKIALHSNRAACYLKLHNFKKAAEECTLVLELDQDHTGALMLRAQTLVTLKEYHAALFDVNRLIELNPSSDVYENLQARLKTQLSLAPIPECENESLLSEIEEDEEEELELREEIEENRIERDDEDEEEIEEQVQLQPQQKVVIAPTDQKPVCPRPVPVLQAPVPKPKGHSRLDYSRWDQVEDDSSEEEDEDDEEESVPQYRFRVRTIGVRPVK